VMEASSVHSEGGCRTIPSSGYWKTRLGTLVATAEAAPVISTAELSNYGELMADG
jgi:hypothetical protein